MHPDEATAAFGRLLAAAPAPRIVVSLRDVAAERARSRGFQLARAGKRRAGQPDARALAANRHADVATAILCPPSAEPCLGGAWLSTVRMRQPYLGV